MQHSQIPILIQKVRKASKDWTLPSVSQVQLQSRDPFQILISCLISLRTKDAVTTLASQRLFAKAKTPSALLKLSQAKIRKLIYPAGFYKTKATRIHEISRMLESDFGGNVPASIEALLTLPGVGRKTANLVVTLAFKKLGICVDTHVHRISNRLGLVKTKQPDETEFALRKILPKRYWIEYNDLLVGFGQNLCRPISPWCSRCPVKSLCKRVGVAFFR